MTNQSAEKSFDVSIEMPGFTRTTDLSEELSPCFLEGFSETCRAENTFPAGVDSVLSASVSGDRDDIEDDEAKVFVRATLRVLAQSETEAERIGARCDRLIATLADILASQSGASIELDEGAPDVEAEESSETTV